MANRRRLIFMGIIVVGLYNVFIPGFIRSLIHQEFIEEVSNFVSNLTGFSSNFTNETTVVITKEKINITRENHTLHFTERDYVNFVKAQCDLKFNNQHKKTGSSNKTMCPCLTLSASEGFSKYIIIIFYIFQANVRGDQID